MKKSLLALLFGTLLVLGACGGGNADKPADTGSTNGTTDVADAEKIYSNSCIGCHGGNLEGKSGPALDKVGGHMTEEEILDVIVNGRGTMPPMLKGDDAEAVAKWLVEKK